MTISPFVALSDNVVRAMLVSLARAKGRTNGDRPGRASVALLAASEIGLNASSLLMSDGRRQACAGPQYKTRPAPDRFAEAKALLGEAAVL